MDKSVELSQCAEDVGRPLYQLHQVDAAGGRHLVAQTDLGHCNGDLGMWEADIMFRNSLPAGFHWEVCNGKSGHFFMCGPSKIGKEE